MTSNPVDVSDVITAVLNDTDMLVALNDNPARVLLSPDGKEAELSIGEAVPYVVVSTIRALASLGVIDFTPTETEDIQHDEPK